jgi:hypothetical protein
MKMGKMSKQAGNVLLCALCTILIVSAIAGTVLINCTTRYNVASGQVQSWKAALMAAEAGGDIAYAEIRKTILDPSNAFPASGWTNSGSVHTKSPITTIANNNTKASSTVDVFYTDASGNPYYRIRSKGSAPVIGLARTGMDDRMTTGARGDSLLRKIDFNYDHFIATYGPNGDGAGKALVAVSQPQLARRLELIAAPLTPFEAAIKASGSFYGLGSAAQIDSYNSKNGPYYFCANNPADPHYSDSRSGSVEIGSSTATIMGMLYGDVATNGGTITRSYQITGTIDNNVPFTLPPLKMPTNLPVPQPSPTTVTSPSSITPPVAGTSAAPTYYVLSALSGKLTVNPVGSAQTYVVIHVTGDVVAEVDVKPNVHLKVIFDGNMNVKARDINNESNLAANLQYYAISPTDPSTIQTIAIAPPGNFAAAIYAPSADVSLTGNPDIIGALICKSFYGNGNTSWHYDRELNNEGDAVDYRIASYVEDIR